MLDYFGNLNGKGSVENLEKVILVEQLLKIQKYGFSNAQMPGISA